MGKELEKEFYDDIFENSVVYRKEAKQIDFYYQTWRMAYDFIEKNNIKEIVDLGCGPGHFATLFEANKNINYTGIDFSSVAIEQASEKNYNFGNSINFINKNLSGYKPLKSNSFFVSFEFLEHISFDLDILRSLNKNNEILFSVPSYDAEGHVRHFLSKEHVEGRYGGVLDLKLINVKAFGTKKIYLYHGVKK